MEKKRWRAESKEIYFFINDYCEITSDNDFFCDEDNARYYFGNYFKTEKEAEKYAEYMKKCSLEWHEKRDK